MPRFQLRSGGWLALNLHKLSLHRLYLHRLCWRSLWPVLLICCLSACSTPGQWTANPDSNQIQTHISAQSQASRVRFVILHYTSGTQEVSLKVLSEQGVSSHYLVGDDAPATVYRLVDENRMAFHAGESRWKNYTQLNASSIGIEIVGLGFSDTPEGRHFAAYPPHQIDRVIALLKDIVQRHQIKPENILGHAEIAPQRKVDPGPLFPWKALADAGLIRWPDAQQVQAQTARFETALPEIAWFQKKLAQMGYATPQSASLDTETRNVLAVFQMRYRPRIYDGQPDAETAALLEVIAGSDK